MSLVLFDLIALLADRLLRASEEFKEVDGTLPPVRTVDGL
jgi:hypothetical protein